MTKPDLERQSSVSVETIGRMAAEVVGTPVKDNDRKAVAELLQSLLTEMSAVRSMDVGISEPATIYDAAEVQS